jgi:hypothetical protein
MVYIDFVPETPRLQVFSEKLGVVKMNSLFTFLYALFEAYVDIKDPENRLEGTYEENLIDDVVHLTIADFNNLFRSRADAPQQWLLPYVAIKYCSSKHGEDPVRNSSPKIEDVCRYVSC